MHYRVSAPCFLPAHCGWSKRRNAKPAMAYEPYLTDRNAKALNGHE